MKCIIKVIKMLRIISRSKAPAQSGAYTIHFKGERLCTAEPRSSFFSNTQKNEKEKRKMMQKEKIWTPTFTINMTLNFLFYLVFYLLTVIIGTVAMTQDHALA